MHGKELTNSDPFVLFAWCIRCTISRMALGFLTPYQAFVAEEVENFLVLRSHMLPYLDTPLLVAYRRVHYLTTNDLTEGPQNPPVFK